MILEKSVLFDSEKFVNVLLVLAAPDQDSHLTLLSELSCVLSSEKKVKALISAKSYNEVSVILQEESK